MPAKKKFTTYVALIVDRSGSMSSCWTEAVSSFKNQLEEFRKQQTKEHQIRVTTVFFDTEVSMPYNNADPNDISDNVIESYAPRGFTALMDAVSQAISHIAANKFGKNDAALIITISDGQENASKEVTKDTFKAKVAEYEGKGNWTFTYLMANVDLSYVVAAFGANASNVAIFNSTPTGTAAAGQTVNRASGVYLNSRTYDPSLLRVSSFYSDEDREKLKNSK